MINSSHLDYIIVGQGLAGSAVAIQLMMRQKKILVIDQPLRNTSSNIAAGLFNPITGKKMVKTWMADKLFPYLHTHYRTVEALTGQKFFNPMPLYRPFLSYEEQNEWMAKSAEPQFQDYIEKVFTQSAFPGLLDPFGGLLLKQCGYLDTRHYVESVRTMLRQQAIVLMEDADDSDLLINDDGIQYRTFTADKIIFCNGTHQNKWFHWLPLRPLKGEAIRIETAYPQELIINRGVYMVPANAPGEWRVGATYNFQDNEPLVTGKARVELSEKLKELVSFPFNIVGQEWGLRPTTPDRRPIMGKHPACSRVYVFNGMGTKGVSLAPFFSEILIRSIENEEPLNKEVDIERYKLLYWSSPT
ncbi:MAG: glycine oxidase [Marivirga sp.]|nr:glycine oxidase [Marivirga sp.]